MLSSILRLAASSKEVSDFRKLTSLVESKIKSAGRIHKQMSKDGGKGLWEKFQKEVSLALDSAVKLHKKVNGTSEFQTLGKSIREVEGELIDSTLPSFQASKVLAAMERLYGDMNRISALASKGYLE